MATAHPIPFLACWRPASHHQSFPAMLGQISSIHSPSPTGCRAPAQGLTPVFTGMKLQCPGVGMAFRGPPTGTKHPLVLCLFLGASRGSASSLLRARCGSDSPERGCAVAPLTFPRWLSPAVMLLHHPGGSRGMAVGAGSAPGTRQSWL